MKHNNFHWIALTPIAIAIILGVFMVVIMALCGSCGPAPTGHTKVRREAVQASIAQAVVDSANYSTPKQHR